MVSPLVVSLKKQNSSYGNKVKVLSPAKINLYLNIIGKYTSGFHRIESIVERVSLYDEITIEVKKESDIQISSNDTSLEGEHNLCFKAADLLKRRLGISSGFNIFLKKRIPIGSGLGGGSSNAAFTLLGINMLLDLKLKQQRLYQLGSELGSDIDFFISQSRFAFIQGRGEKVTPLSGKVFRHLIVWPGVNLSTKMVYQNSRVKLTKHLNNVKMLNYALKKGDNFLLKKSIFNALEKTALSISGQLREAKEYLSRRGIFARVTGSGSALYTILDKFTHYNIKKSLPKGWFIFEVQTF